MKALLIEDDPEIVESVSIAFAIGWPEVQLLYTNLGKRGIELLESQDPDVVILDLGLPDVNGWEVLKRIRLFSSVPVLILTVRADEHDIAKGLGLGALDYLVKPCDYKELLARVKTMIDHET